MLGDDSSNTIIAYGAGKFNASSPGYKSSPTRSSYFANRLKKVHNATVLNIWEFNTSQICSKCQAPVKLCGVATQQDPFMTPANIVQKHHFVRRCTNNLCRIIWNRDVNAARNMAFLAIHSTPPFLIPQVCTTMTSCKRPRPRRNWLRPFH